MYKIFWWHFPFGSKQQERKKFLLVLNFFGFLRMWKSKLVVSGPRRICLKSIFSFLQIRRSVGRCSASRITRILRRDNFTKSRTQTHHEKRRYMLLHEHYQRGEFSVCSKSKSSFTRSAERRFVLCFIVNRKKWTWNNWNDKKKLAHFHLCRGFFVFRCSSLMFVYNFLICFVLFCP